MGDVESLREGNWECVLCRGLCKCKKCKLKQLRDCSGKVLGEVDVVAYKSKGKQNYRIDNFVIIEKELKYNKDKAKPKPMSTKTRSSYNKAQKPLPKEPQKRPKREHSSNIPRTKDPNPSFPYNNEERVDVQEVNEELRRMNSSLIPQGLSYMYLGPNYLQSLVQTMGQEQVMPFTFYSTPNYKLIRQINAGPYIYHGRGRLRSSL